MKPICLMGTSAMATRADAPEAEGNAGIEPIVIERATYADT